MMIHAQRIGPVTLLELRGRMDSTNRDRLLNLIDRELNNGSRQIILNLWHVTYMSAAGLKVLRRIEEAYGQVRIVNPSVRVQQLLELTGLDKRYQLFTTPAEAIHTVTPVVNAHTHLELSWLDPHRPDVTGQDFTRWILDTVGSAGRALGSSRERTFALAAERGIQALVDSGTTTVGDITALGASIEPLLLSGLRGVVYCEVIAVNPQQGDEQMTRARTLIDRWRPLERNGLKIGLSLHAPYSLLPEFMRQGLEYARQENLPLCIHAAESAEEAEFFKRGTGPVADHARSMGMNWVTPGISPIAYLDDIGALELQPLLVHCVQVDDDDVRRIQEHGCAVVHCPRSNLRLRCGRMPLEKFLAAGVKVYLGTDSLGSSPSLNVMDEMEVAVALHHGHVEPGAIARLVHQPFEGA